MRVFAIIFAACAVSAGFHSAIADSNRAYYYDRESQPEYSGARDDGPEIIRADDFRPIVLCRRRGCTQAGDKISKSFLFNVLSNLFYINDKTKVHLCEADTRTRACVRNTIRYAANIGGTPAIADIPSFTINDVSFSRDLKRASFSIFYDIYINGNKTFCSDSKNSIEITDRMHALIRDSSYACQLTSDAPSEAYAVYNIDYIDLDYGIIGAYYSMGMSGAGNSDGADGYILMKFKNADNGKSLSASQGSCAFDCDEDEIIPPGEYRVSPLAGEGPAL